MAVLTPQKIATGGLAPVTVSAAGGGDKLPAGPGRFVQVINGSGGSINVTINSIKPCDQGFDHNVVVAVAAGATKLLGPFNDRYVDSDGYVELAYSAVTTVTVAALEL